MKAWEKMSEDHNNKDGTHEDSDENAAKHNPLSCIFCGRSREEVHQLVGGSGVYVCDECLRTCMDLVDYDLDFMPSTMASSKNMLEEELREDSKVSGSIHSDEFINEEDFILNNLPTPKQLFDELSKYVVGQDNAKRALSVAVYNHYKRIGMEQLEKAGLVNFEEEDDVEISKSNVLLLGPTGSGKTLLARTLARILKVPFAIGDATTLTEAGYVGEDVENILLKLITAADFDIERAQMGIIYIDEIDKVARKAENVSLTRDVSGEGVQQALLKIVEGTEASVPPQGGRKHPHQELISIDTTNILFILGGAFVGLDRIIGARVGKGGIGFASDVRGAADKEGNQLLSQVTPEDLQKFGMIPEFIGRIPVICSLDELDEDALVRILTEPKNALVKQYRRLFEFDGTKLTFTDEALHEIAKETILHGTGARGLRAICERVLQDTMYELPERLDVSEVVVTSKSVKGEIPPTSIKVEPEQADNPLESIEIPEIAVLEDSGMSGETNNEAGGEISTRSA